MIDKSTSANLDRIFDEMYNLISAASRIPLTDKIIVEESDLAEILDDLKEAIPREVKSAAKLLEEQKAIVNKAHEDADNIVLQAKTENKAHEDADNIVLQAKTEADRILEIAKSEAERLVRQEEVVQQAQAFADDVKSVAERNAQEVKEEADAYAERVKMDVLQYADDMLAYLSGNLQSALQGLNENRGSVNEERRKLAAPQQSEYFGDELPEDEEEEK